MARRRRGGDVLGGLLLVLGFALLGAGGWMQVMKPDYRSVRSVVPVGPPVASTTEPQPVPQSLIVSCFVSGLLLLGVGIAVK
jgi:hypothetical protein